MSRIKGRQQINRMPIIGKIKIGMKNEKGLPTSLDYFRATGMYAPIFHNHFGDKPNKLTIIFPSNNVEDICNQRMELRDSKGRLFATSDGEMFSVFNTKLQELGKEQGKLNKIIKESNKELSEGLNKAFEGFGERVDKGMR